MNAGPRTLSGKPPGDSFVSNRRFYIWLAGFLAPSLAFVFGVYKAANTWETVRTSPKPIARTLKVSGSAQKRIISDLIEWEAQIRTRAQDRTVGFRELNQHMAAAVAYLTKQGVKRDEIHVSSASTHEIIEVEYQGTGAERIQRRVSKGWVITQSVSVRSTDIKRVEKVSREITNLLEKGVPISSGTPQYHYTKLGEVKVEMLAAAAENARIRAEKIVEASGSKKKLGKLWGANMGVINVNPANSTATSWQGNNDKTSYEKDIITIVHLTFQLP